MPKATQSVSKRSKPPPLPPRKPQKKKNAIKAPVVRRRSGVVSITHRELVSSLTSQNGPVDLGFRYSLHPSNVAAFPWLSGLTGSFEYYKMKSLRAYYEPSCNLKNGSLTMGIDYDINDAPLTSRQDVAALKGAARTKVTSEVSISADTRSLQLYEYRYLNATETQGDARLQTIGWLYAWLKTSDTDTEFGDLFLEYDIELFGPQVPAPISLFTDSSYGLPNDEDITYTTATWVSPGNIIGGDRINEQHGITRSLSTDKKILTLTFPGPGTYKVNLATEFGVAAFQGDDPMDTAHIDLYFPEGTHDANVEQLTLDRALLPDSVTPIEKTYLGGSWFVKFQPALNAIVGNPNVQSALSYIAKASIHLASGFLYKRFVATQAVDPYRMTLQASPVPPLRIEEMELISLRKRLSAMKVPRVRDPSLDREPRTMSKPQPVCSRTGKY